MVSAKHSGMRALKVHWSPYSCLLYIQKIQTLHLFKIGICTDARYWTAAAGFFKAQAGFFFSMVVNTPAGFFMGVVIAFLADAFQGGFLSPALFLLHAGRFFGAVEAFATPGCCIIRCSAIASMRLDMSATCPLPPQSSQLKLRSQRSILSTTKYWQQSRRRSRFCLRTLLKWTFPWLY